MRSGARPEEVHIAVLPAIAQLWLSPRLPDIRAALPDLRISVTVLESPPNLAREPFDLSIFLDESGVEAIETDSIFPVCAPEIASRINTVNDLQNHPCLRDGIWKDDWQTWLTFAAPGQRMALSGPVFSLYAQAMQEAINGAGVLMAHGPLVHDELAEGTLVCPFGPKIETGSALTLGIRPGPRPRGLEQLIRLLSGEGRL